MSESAIGQTTRAKSCWSPEAENHTNLSSRGNDYIPSGQPKPLETPLTKTHEAWDPKLNSTAYPFAFNTQSRESHEPQQPRERSQASRIFARFTAPFAKPPLDSISITSQQLYRLHHLA